MKKPSNKSESRQDAIEMIVLGKMPGSEPQAGIFTSDTAFRAMQSQGEGFKLLYAELANELSNMGLQRGEMEGEPALLHEIDSGLFERLDAIAGERPLRN
jgi:hypothetical protein